MIMGQYEKELSTIVSKLKKKYPMLANVSYWDKFERDKIYINHKDSSGIDYSFNFDIKDGIVRLFQYNEKIWQEKGLPLTL
jgi:hypothetical protein